MEEELLNIKERNKRVEADKAWETSKTRRFIIAVLTYLVMVVFLYVINVQRPWINALVPTLGFILSTLTLSIFKKIWLKQIYRK